MMDLHVSSIIFLLLFMLQPIKTHLLTDDDNSVKIAPTHYELNIQIFPDEENFLGQVVIDVLWLERTNIVSLNAHENLTIDNIHVIDTSNQTGVRGKEVNIQKTEHLFDTSTLNFALEKAFDGQSECKITVKFSGKLNTHTTKGLFKKSFVDATTKKPKWIIASDLKNGFASSVFPCFDKLMFKTTFVVKIQRPSSTRSLSTMPLKIAEQIENGWTQDSFSITPRMAVSSLAIFVSDFPHIPYTKLHFQIQIWPAPELLEAMRHNRSQLIHNSLITYEKIFGLRYPLPKLDYIALPSLMNVNVYTNWGLVISSNTNLGYNQARERWTVFNEMGSQWIGNFLSPASSGDEIGILAFNNFCSMFYYTKDVKETEDLWNYWPLSNLYANYYQLGNPTPTDNSEIRRMSAVASAEIVYRMIMYTLTEQTFSTALKNFIPTKACKTFKMEDFWSTLTKQAHVDGNLPPDITVEEIVSSWLEKARLPYITVARNYDAKSVLLTQQLFIRIRPQYIVKDEHKLWTIPVVLTTQDKLDFKNTKAIHWMKEKNLEIKNVSRSDKFIIVNPEEISPYMVNYDKSNWNMLADFLQSDQVIKIPPITRAKLVHDALNLAYAGKLDFGTALNMTLFLKNETEYTPWKPFFIMFDHIGRHIDGTKVHKKYETFVGILTRSLYSRLTTGEAYLCHWTDDFIYEVKAVLRNIADQRMVKQANTLFNNWMEGLSISLEDIRKNFGLVFEYGTKEQWEFGFEYFRNLERKAETRETLFRALVGFSKDFWKMKKILHVTLFEQGDVFTDDDFNYAVFMNTGGAAGYMATFEYLNENWNALKIRLQNKPEIWKQLVYTATSLHKTQDGLNQVTEFYSKHRGQFGEAETTIQNSLKKIKEEVQWTNENMKPLEEWLDNYISKNSHQN